MPSLLYRDPHLDLWVNYVTRAEWGSTQATEDFIRNRYSATAIEKTNAQIHNTAAIDPDDLTPNQWDYDEAVAYVRRLQTSRPDLGPLPYSENVAVAEDNRHVWIFEGRGLLKVGAHTAGYNRSGIGWGVLGNFDRVTSPETLAAIRRTISLRVQDLRANGFPNLCTLKNPFGWDVWGHRDTSTKSCPGNNLYPQLAYVTIEPEDEVPLNQVERRVVDIAFDLLGAQGDRNYWYQKENDDPEFETLLKPAMQQGSAALRARLAEVEREQNEIKADLRQAGT